MWVKVSPNREGTVTERAMIRDNRNLIVHPFTVPSLTRGGLG